MNKFTKVKKALAVSLCSSMLFSGASKTLGMENSLRALNTENSSLRHLSYAGEISTATLEWVLGTAAVVALGYIFNFTVKSLDINENIYKADNWYNKINSLVNLLKDKHVNNNICDTKEYDKCCARLKLAKTFLDNAKNNKICCNGCSCLVSFFLCRAKSKSRDVEEQKNEVINNVAEALNKFSTLMENSNLDLPSSAKSLLNQLIEIIESINSSKFPEVNLNLAFKTTLDFLEEAKIINYRERNSLMLQKEVPGCFKKCFSCFFKCFEKKAIEENPVLGIK